MSDSIKSLENTGIVMIIAGGLFSILSYFEFFLNIHLLASPKYTELSEFGPAGMDFVQALSIHLGSIVIALGIVVVYLARHYTPEIDKYMTVAVICWFILDSSSSLIFNYGYNLIPNIIFLSGFGIVIFLVKRDYRENHLEESK